MKLCTWKTTGRVSDLDHRYDLIISADPQGVD